MDHEAEPSAPSAGPEPDSLPPRRPGSGCVRGLGIACGAIISMAAIVFAAVYLNYGAFVTWLEFRAIRGSLERSGAGPEIEDRVERVLRDYDAARKKEDLGISQWREAARAFEKSPAVVVLIIREFRKDLESIEGLKPEEIDRLRRVLQGLERGVAGGSISPGDYLGLVGRSRLSGPSVPEKESPLEASIGAGEVQRFLEEGEKLLARRGIGEGPAALDLPDLLRRDLWNSLSDAKRAGPESPPAPAQGKKE